MRAALVIAAVALLIMVPLAYFPPQSQQSWWIDVNWLTQFTDQLRAGHIYPRWMPDSHGGSGAPVFYFYGPLAFYLGAPFVLAGVDPYLAVILTFGTISFIMGWTAYRWLEGSERPLIAAVLFMIMPYTLIDFYARAAMGEFLGIAMLPLIALAIRDRHPLLLAFSYAGLIYSHLPLALLASIFMIAPYGLWRWHRDIRGGVPLAVALLAGLLIASPYMVPALMLQDHINADFWTHRERYQPSNWMVTSGWIWETPFAAAMSGIIIATGLASLLLVRRSFWSILAPVVIAIVLFGFGLWSIPLLAKVQFPFRAMPIAGLALVTAFAWEQRRLRLVASAAILLPVALATPFLLQSKPLVLSDILESGIEVAEYLPAAIPDVEAPSQWALEQEGTFYFPSLGRSRDKVFLDGEPDLVMLTEERIGWVLALLGLLMAALLAPMRSRPQVA